MASNFTTMKPLFVSATLACVLSVGALAAPRAANTSARHARALHFARGAYTLSVRDTINNSNHASRFYTLKMNAGQHLKISAKSVAKDPDHALVPLIFVTPPCGKYNGDKTFNYNEDSSRAGTYQIEVAANSMASTATQGAFELNVSAY